jgi:hypothetical protein
MCRCEPDCDNLFRSWHSFLSTHIQAHPRVPRRALQTLRSTSRHSLRQATLTRDERFGVYKRLPDIHSMAFFTHEETALMTFDLAAFNKLMQERLSERAEAALLDQIAYWHTTTRATVTL